MPKKVKYSKQKGARFERLLASKFREHGYDDARRTAQYCGNTGDASDVVGLPGIHIEAKHVERLNIYEAIDQARRDSQANGGNKLPTVFHKKNNCDILVTLMGCTILTNRKACVSCTNFYVEMRVTD